MPEWRVYSRAGCCLCEQMIEELAQLLGPAAVHVQVVDIASNPELERKYGSRIPVLTVDDELVCAYRLDTERLQHWLEAGSAQAGDLRQGAQTVSRAHFRILHFKRPPLRYNPPPFPGP